ADARCQRATLCGALRHKRAPAVKCGNEARTCHRRSSSAKSSHLSPPPFSPARQSTSISRSSRRVFNSTLVPYLRNGSPVRAWIDMLSSLVIMSGVLGGLVYFGTWDWRWLLGAALILANWPYTLWVVIPVNKRLEATTPESANAETRDLVKTWGK